MLESRFQARLVKKLRDMFPGCMVLKNDTEHTQGVPDLLVLCGDKWAMLEVKSSERAAIQPNQDYYIGTLNDMSYAAFIYPENEEDVLNDLQHLFSSCR